MRNLIIVLIAILGLSSCQKEEVNAYWVDVSFDFAVKDKMGNDLLDPTNENGLNISKIKIFSVKENGELKDVYNAKYTVHPQGFIYIEKSEFMDEFRVRIILEDDDKVYDKPGEEIRDINNFIVQWNDSKSDKLDAEIIRNSGLSRVTKLWLNDELVWDLADRTEKFIELIK